MNELLTQYINWVVANPVLSFGILLVEYAVIMTIAAQTKFRALSKLGTLLFIPQDVVMNLTLLTILFLDMPKEWLVTGRMKRYKLYYSKTRSGKMEEFRYWFAVKLCNYLNYFDEKGHC